MNEQTIEQSLEAVKKGRALSRDDFAKVVRAFALQPDKNRFLLTVNTYNEKLAETLLIFHTKIAAEITAGSDLASLTDQLFLHYIINTKGPIIEVEGSDEFDVFDAATRYGGALSIDLVKGPDGGSVMHINEKEILCPDWLTGPGRSAASTLREVGSIVNRARYGRDDVIPSYAFGFDENATAHTLKNAMIMADFAHLAYFKPSYIKKQLEAWGYHSFTWIENVLTDTQVFVAGKNDYLVVCIRGTSSWKDWLIDLDFRKVDAFGGHGKVHSGFQRSLESVWSAVQAAVNKLGADKRLFFCGHSLGAAIAQLAAYRFALLNYNVAHVYVFGSPRAANREFMEHYNELLATKTFLHINNKDIVTTVPLALLGFYHLGGKPRSFDNGHEITNVENVMAEIAGTDKEMRFEDLDVETQEKIRLQINEVEESIRASTRFLTTDPNRLSVGNYETQFNAGAINEHAMNQYLFKFACAIVDEAWDNVRKAQTKEPAKHQQDGLDGGLH